jgi:hypothetical protein
MVTAACRTATASARRTSRRVPRRSQRLCGEEQGTGRQAETSPGHTKLRAMGTGEYEAWQAICVEQGYQQKLLEVSTECDEGSRRVRSHGAREEGAEGTW